MARVSTIPFRMVDGVLDDFACLISLVASGFVARETVQVANLTFASQTFGKYQLVESVPIIFTFVKRFGRKLERFLHRSDERDTGAWLSSFIILFYWKR